MDIPRGRDPAARRGGPAGRARLLWDTEETVRSFHPDWSPSPGTGRISLAFACDGPAEVDSAYAAAVAAGAHGEKEPWDAVWGQRYAIFHDPDGNSVDLFAPLPPTSAPRTAPPAGRAQIRTCASRAGATTR
ncbi:VOC family protein [Streptomyces sp. M19]